MSDNLLSRAPEKIEYALLDFETTGSSPAYGHRVCELGLLVIEMENNDKQLDYRPVESYQQLIDPRREISPGARAVNGITRDMVEGKPFFEEITEPLLELISGRPLVAHHAPFDMKFLAAELELAGEAFPNVPVLDSCALARRQFDFASNALENIAATLGVDRPTHRALDDVQALADIWAHLLAQLIERGVQDLGELLEKQGGEVKVTKPDSPRSLPLPINEALATRRPLKIEYQSAGGRRSTRKITPLKATRNNERDYLIAHCHRSGAQRTFRVDRIIGVDGGE